VDEYIECRGVVDRVVRAEYQGLGADGGRTVGREAERVPTVLGMLLRPVGEHLPRTDSVELLDPVEEEQSDVTALPGVWSWVVDHGAGGGGVVHELPPGVSWCVGPGRRKGWPARSEASRPTAAVTPVKAPGFDRHRWSANV
jgi:hypothetical protein